VYSTVLPSASLVHTAAAAALSGKFVFKPTA